MLHLSFLSILHWMPSCIYWLSRHLRSNRRFSSWSRWHSWNSIEDLANVLACIAWGAGCTLHRSTPLHHWVTNSFILLDNWEFATHRTCMDLTRGGKRSKTFSKYWMKLRKRKKTRGGTNFQNGCGEDSLLRNYESKWFVNVLFMHAALFCNWCRLPHTLL